MNSIHQAAAGVFVAAVLMLGASAGSHNGVRPVTPAHGIMSVGTEAVLANLSEVYRTCRDEVLDHALDAFGEIAGRLKQH